MAGAGGGGDGCRGFFSVKDPLFRESPLRLAAVAEEENKVGNRLPFGVERNILRHGIRVEVPQGGALRLFVPAAKGAADICGIAVGLMRQLALLDRLAANHVAAPGVERNRIGPENRRILRPPGVEGDVPCDGVLVKVPPVGALRLFVPAAEGVAGPIRICNGRRYFLVIVNRYLQEGPGGPGAVQVKGDGAGNRRPPGVEHKIASHRVHAEVPGVCAAGLLVPAAEGVAGALGGRVGNGEPAVVGGCHLMVFMDRPVDGPDIPDGIAILRPLGVEGDVPGDGVLVEVPRGGALRLLIPPAEGVADEAGVARLYCGAALLDDLIGHHAAALGIERDGVGRRRYVALPAGVEDEIAGHTVIVEVPFVQAFLFRVPADEGAAGLLGKEIGFSYRCSVLNLSVERGIGVRLVSTIPVIIVVAMKFDCVYDRVPAGVEGDILHHRQGKTMLFAEYTVLPAIVPAGEAVAGKGGVGVGL